MHSYTYLRQPTGIHRESEKNDTHIDECISKRTYTPVHACTHPRTHTKVQTRGETERGPETILVTVKTFFNLCLNASVLSVLLAHSVHHVEDYLFVAAL